MLKTLNQALQVLNLFTRETPVWSAREIADHLDLNQITVYRILETFVNNQFLTKNNKTKQYQIDASLARFGHLSFERYNVAAIVQPILYHLMKQSGESVYLTKRTDLHAVTIDAFEPENKVSFAVPLNQSMPLYAGASYWSILAFLNPADIQEVLNTPFDELLDPQALTAEQLEEQLAHVRKHGWCVSQELVTPEVTAIAAPVFSAQQVIGSLTIAKPIYRTSESDIQPLGELVRSKAQQISVELTKHGQSFDYYSFFKENMTKID